MKRTYRNFVIPGVAKVNIDGYFDWVKLTTYQGVIGGPGKGNASCKGNYNAMGKIEESGAQGVGGNTVDNYTWVDIPLNSLMTEFFEDSDTD